MANKKTENQMNKVQKSTVDTAIKAVATTENTKVTIDGAVIINVTSPSTIQRIADERGLNPQEVFVRCTFQYKDQLFTASNKLRFLTKAGYLELITARDKKTPMKLVVDIEKAFFYIEHDVEVDSLFNTPVTSDDKRSTLTALLNA